MRPSLVRLTVWALALASPSVGQSLTRLSTLLNQAQIPGASAVIVDLRTDDVNGSLVFDNGVAWMQHFGLARLGCSRPDDASSSGGEPCLVTDDTVFGVGKISSLLIATAVMRSVQEGYVDLDEPVVTYLASRGTDLAKRKLPSVWTFHDPVNMFERVTLRHLLSHTACIGDDAYILAKETSLGDKTKTIAQFLREKMPQASSWRGGCTLGKDYHYSTLGLTLAAHAIEYVDERLDSDFVRFGARELLPEIGLANAGWRLAQLTNRGAVAEPYSFKLDSDNFNRWFENLPTTLVSSYETQVFDNACEWVLEPLNMTNSTNETLLVFQNCTSKALVQVLPSVASGEDYFRAFGQYGRADTVATMLRASAKELAKVLALHMGNGVTVGGQDFLNASLAREMRQIEVELDEGAVGLAWELTTEDGRDLFEINVGDRNPGMAGSISFHESAGVGLILLANGDSSIDERGIKYHRESEIMVDEALKLVRTYLFDWYELNFVPSAVPKSISFLDPPPSKPVLNSTALGMIFQLFAVESESVGYSVTYAGLDVTEGHYIKVVSGSTIFTHFPVGFPARPYSQAGRDAAVPTGNSSGQVRGIVDNLSPGSFNAIEAQILNWEDTVMQSEALSIQTLRSNAPAPDMSVSLAITCATPTEVYYSVEYHSVPIDEGYQIHLSYLEAPYHAPYSPPKRLTEVYLPTLQGGFSGRILDLTTSTEHTFKAAIVDFYRGSWVWDEVVVFCS